MVSKELDRYRKIIANIHTNTLGTTCSIVTDALENAWEHEPRTQATGASAKTLLTSHRLDTSHTNQ